MGLVQMASRCPASILHGIGIIHGYKWAVNSRGGGNIVKESKNHVRVNDSHGDGGNESVLFNRENRKEAEQEAGDYVQGILFRVDPCDLEALRQYERVAEGFFIEKEMLVEVAPFEMQKCTDVDTKNGAQILEAYREARSRHVVDKVAPCRKNKRPGLRHDVTLCKALVYLVPEPEMQGPDKIRDEYRIRMEIAIADGMLLGISIGYVEKYFHPLGIRPTE